ncbi:hypothetical protein [Candidatus Nitrosotenuis aquarius]|uniref:hypothetical protein n=1 Tax=Candidatus Nitrosotenuis aquarius TaxID=1846278 RepID=UPI000C1E6925|nr:hypothetical protein [Candidatus Nitrosotenuis aquarius]
MTKLLQVLIAAGILSISLFTANVYASENANCSRDCEAPTLGVTDSGQRVIDYGLAINGRTFEVDHQIQTNPTMTFTTGNTAKVKLMIYENDGVDEFRHASIAITDYMDDKNQNDKVLISFDQTFDGVQSFEVTDANGYVKDVNVKATQLDQWRTEVVYSFKPVKPFETSALVVEMWDEERSSRSNVFLNAVKATGEEIIEYVPVQSPYVPPPLQQVNDGIAPQDVECRQGLELVIRVTGTPACVYPFTADTLRAWGLVE